MNWGLQLGAFCGNIIDAKPLNKTREMGSRITEFSLSSLYNPTDIYSLGAKSVRYVSLTFDGFATSNRVRLADAFFVNNKSRPADNRPLINTEGTSFREDC